MLNIYQVPTEEVNNIEWKGDFLEYDQQLFQLGNGYEEFLVVNPDPDFEYVGLHNLISSLPPTPSIKCIVWKYKGTWLAKYFHKSWTPEMDYWPVNINLLWERNPDIPEAIPFLNDPTDRDILDPFDLHYEMEWYLDPSFNNTNDKIWIKRCKLYHILFAMG